MRRLNYNIYSNISDEQYFSLEDKLVKIESAMSKELFKNGWRLSNTVKNADGLAVDFIFKDGEFYGNICILFDDLPKRKTFTFGVTKSFDEKHKRYFIRADIFQHEEFEYFENNVSEFVAMALEQYSAWSRYNIIYSGITVDLNN